MSVPERVLKLIDNFAHNIDSYKNQTYNEAQLRREFIDPFFEELGWDITNKGGLAQAYKDVIHEDAIKIGGYTKAKHDKVVKLVDQMLDLHKRLTKAKVPAEKTRIQRQITATDKQIDKLVYDLYDLTPEEIKIVEDTD